MSWTLALAAVICAPLRAGERQVAPLALDMRRLRMTVSVGISSMRHGRTPSSAELLRESDAALYEAKKTRDRLAAFSGQVLR